MPIKQIYMCVCERERERAVNRWLFVYKRCVYSSEHNQRELNNSLERDDKSQQWQLRLFRQDANYKVHEAIHQWKICWFHFRFISLSWTHSISFLISLFYSLIGFTRPDFQIFNFSFLSSQPTNHIHFLYNL